MIFASGPCLTYSSEENGNYKKANEFTIGYKDTINLTERGMEKPGYYKFQLQVLCEDLQKALPSDYSESTAPHHFTK